METDEASKIDDPAMIRFIAGGLYCYHKYQNLIINGIEKEP